MRFKNKLAKIRKKMQSIQRKTVSLGLAFAPIRLFIKNRRAINAIISNLILIAAVVVVGFVALEYASSTSSNYQSRYGQTVNADISKMKETLSFEYAYYNSSGKLLVYIMNSGTIDMTIQSVSVDSLAKNFMLYSLSGQQITNLPSGGEAYILSSTNLASGVNIIKITSGRGSIFEYNVVA